MVRPEIVFFEIVVRVSPSRRPGTRTTRAPGGDQGGSIHGPRRRRRAPRTKRSTPTVASNRRVDAAARAEPTRRCRRCLRPAFTSSDDVVGVDATAVERSRVGSDTTKRGARAATTATTTSPTKKYAWDGFRTRSRSRRHLRRLGRRSNRHRSSSSCVSVRFGDAFRLTSFLLWIFLLVISFASPLLFCLFRFIFGGCFSNKDRLPARRSLFSRSPGNR